MKDPYYEYYDKLIEQAWKEHYEKRGKNGKSTRG